MDGSIGQTQSKKLEPSWLEARGFASPTLFRFAIDYTEWADGGRYPAIQTEWAPDARTALHQACNHLAGVRGVLSIDAIDPEPSHVKFEGETTSLHQIGEGDRILAKGILALQSGAETPADVLRLLARDADEYGRELIAELQPAPEDKLLAQYANAAE